MIRIARRSEFRAAVTACLVAGSVTSGASEVYAQGRDSLLNGVIIGGAAGAAAGIGYVHLVRDSDLTASQYARGAIVFGAIGAGIGLGIDAAFYRTATGRPVTPRRMLVAPAVWRNVASVAVKWRW
jgi:hypothetical protein